MFDIEATVTAATPTELKLTADWPIRWLEAAGLLRPSRLLNGYRIYEED
jgi:hypothetical protein